MVGAATYVKPLSSAAVPPAVVTETSTAPAGPVGVVTTIEEAESLVTVPALEPNLTDVAELRLEPVIVTEVPPAEEPELGDTPEMLGAAT
jgi:hypothetical protein